MLAKTVLAAATTVAVAVALAPSAFATAPRDPGCYITDNNASPGAYSYALEFYRTCGYSVRCLGSLERLALRNGDRRRKHC